MMDRTTYPPELRSSTDARRHAERVLDGWRIDGVLDAARLLVSEVVVNAVLHAGTEVEMVLRLEAERLRVEVSDRSPVVPRARAHSPRDPTGRGLLIVDELADSWGVDVADEGKTVWFELVVASSPGEDRAGTSGSVVDG